MKGITPVIAIILLLLVTISIVGFSFTFLSGTVETLGEGGQQALEHTVSQMGQNFKIEGTDENTVYVRNLGTSELSSLTFFVDNTYVDSTGSPIPPNSVGAFVLNDSKLAMLPGKELKVSSSGRTIEKEVNFYQENTVGYWKFDEGSGTAISDSSGSNNGTLYLGSETMNHGSCDPVGNTCPVWTDGKYGKALLFDGIDDNITISDDPSLRPSQLTLSAWIYITQAPTSSKSIIDKYTGGSHVGYGLGIDSARYVYLRLYDGTNDYYLKSTQPVPLNTWTYIAGSFDGSNWIVAVNEAYATQTQSLTIAYNAKDLEISCHYESGCFNGIIDEARIYDVALNQAELKEDMNSAYPIRRAAASYTFNEGSGTTAKDSHQWIKGISGAALEFDGVDDFVDAGNDPSLRVSGDMTLMLWLKPNNLGASRQNPLDKSYGGEFALTLEDGSYTGALTYYHGTQRASGYYWSWWNPFDAGTIVNDAWQSIVITRDTATMTMKSYYNGQLIHTTTYSSDPDRLPSPSTYSVKIGDGYSDEFDGAIDEVRILNIARSM